MRPWYLLNMEIMAMVETTVDDETRGDMKVDED